ncbi:MAG TPA: SUMF1/EgtB/PvdO family nonheme iron enzyme [Xanthobacteraceae bacterium]|nr:SUMF1/EgtB/PvdO family nonheme iron enzyme [Xanthobacteraceae bacterium]
MRLRLAVTIYAAAAVAAFAQTASPNSPIPEYPRAEKFDAGRDPLSAKQSASMIAIAGGTYTIGSPDNHPLTNRAALPVHQVAIAGFKIDRTEVTNAQFAEFLNALPIKPRGNALGGAVAPENIPQAGHRLFLEFSSNRLTR